MQNHLPTRTEHRDFEGDPPGHRGVLGAQPAVKVLTAIDLQ